VLACNIGKTDKTVRYIIGIVILILGLVFNSWWGLLGLAPILNAAFGRCGFYYLLNINTAKSDNKTQ